MKKVFKIIGYLLLFLIVILAVIVSAVIYDSIDVELPQCGNESIENNLAKTRNKGHLNVDMWILDEEVVPVLKGIEIESSHAKRVCQVTVEISYLAPNKPNIRETLKYEFVRWTGSGNGYDTHWLDASWLKSE